jgi:hypothetical protein
MLRWLRRLGLDPGHANRQGHSALHKAAYKGHSAVVHWLVDVAGVDPRPLDRGGYSPAVIAKMQHHTELAGWLLTAERRWAVVAGDDGGGISGVGREANGEVALGEYTHSGPLGVLVPIEGARGETGA